MIKIKLIKANPLSLQPVLALHNGYFKEYNLDVDITLCDTLKPFYIEDTTANVGDITRIFEHIYHGTKMIVTSDLTRTMKLILVDDYLKKEVLTLGFSPNQSLGIYCEEYLKTQNIKYINTISTSIAHRKNLINKRLLDGACMIDPFLNEMIGKGYKVVFEGKNHAHNYTCWAFREEYVTNNKQNVLNFHKALNKAGEFYNNLDKQAKIALAKKHLDIPLHLEEFYGDFVFNKDKQYSYEALETAYQWKISKEEIYKDLDISNLILEWDKL